MTKESMIEALIILSKRKPFGSGHSQFEEIQTIFREYRRLLTFVPDKYNFVFSDLQMELGNIESSLDLAGRNLAKKKPVKFREYYSEALRRISDDIEHFITLLKREDVEF